MHFLFVDGAELGEGVDDVVGAIAAKVRVFAIIKEFNFGGVVGLAEDFQFGFSLLEGDVSLGGIDESAGGAD